MAAADARPRAIDGTKIKEYLNCPRVPWLSLHAPELAAPPTARMRVLFRAGHRIERELLERLGAEPVSFRPGDFDAGFAATLEAMDRGAPVIANGVLKLGEFLGRPDLLLRDEPTGVYEVADIKSAREAHPAALLQVAFYSRLLAQIRPPPRRGHVILREGERVTFELSDLAATLEHVLGRLQGFRARRDADPGAHLTEACFDCRYRDACLGDLEAAGDPSLIGGTTRGQVAALRDAGIETVAALAAMSSLREASAASGLAVELLRRLRERARALRDGAPRPLAPPRADLAEASFALAVWLDERQSRPLVAIGGILLDGSGTHRVRVLHGLDETAAAASLRALLLNASRSRGPVLVYGQRFTRFLDLAAQRWPALLPLVASLQPRLLDLRAELRRAVAMPGFDRGPAFAARAAGLARDGREGLEVAALRFLEEGEGDAAVLEALLRDELETLAALRRFVLAMHDAAAAAGEPRRVRGSRP